MSGKIHRYLAGVTGALTPSWSALGRFGEYRRRGLRPIPLGFTEYIAME
jgi:hypothetical protein